MSRGWLDDGAIWRSHDLPETVSKSARPPRVSYSARIAGSRGDVQETHTLERG